MADEGNVEAAKPQRRIYNSKCKTESPKRSRSSSFDNSSVTTPLTRRCDRSQLFDRYANLHLLHGINNAIDNWPKLVFLAKQAMQHDCQLLAHLAAWHSHDSELNLVWKPPPKGVWKINFDATIRGGIAYIAVVCRTSFGVITHVASDFIVTNNPLRAEIHAAFLACRIASFLCLHSVLLEGHSLITCRAVNEEGFFAEGPLVGFVTDVRSSLAAHPDWSLQWTSRRQNSLAHLLAAWTARSMSFGFIPLSAVPLYVATLDVSFEPP
ncbi:hypothetical protein CJ030_MR5G000867 [Morella rubra]|uniref:RNase H type-1 domain-containing protein n=1 Tax=Morella rubra TaxID=262757 RepID=A0A6A1VS31_9ROSI|nr:hypothetical protein CJ030_MR5G000867 [Morella rubra]